MSELRAIADAIQAGRQRPASNPSNHLQHDDLATLLLAGDRTRCIMHAATAD